MEKSQSIKRIGTSVKGNEKVKGNDSRYRYRFPGCQLFKINREKNIVVGFLLSLTEKLSNNHTTTFKTQGPTLSHSE